MAAVSASKMACMSSARPMTPSSATDFPGLTTSSMPGPHAGHQALPAPGVVGAAGAEQRPPVGHVHFTFEAEEGRTRATPGHRRLTPGRVIVECVGHRVVAPAGHGVLVVGDGVGPHHPHPRHVTLLLTPDITRIWQRHVANVSKTLCCYTGKAQRLKEVSWCTVSSGY